MNTDGDDLIKKRKATARIVCIVGAVLVLIPMLGLRWVKASRGDAGITPLFVEAGDESKSNLDLVEMYNEHAPEDKKLIGTFAYAGIACLFFAVVGAGTVATAAGMSFKDKFMREPFPLTTIALLALSASLIAGCVFLGSIPNGILHGGVSWPFFLYGTGIVTALAGAQMLAKAYAEVRDPYWDGQV
jgi:hypothetical protein